MEKGVGVVSILRAVRPKNLVRFPWGAGNLSLLKSDLLLLLLLLLLYFIVAAIRSKLVCLVTVNILIMGFQILL